MAAGEVGVMEVPPGSNRGPRVDQFLNAVGPGLLGQPWCMAFIYFCFVQAAQGLGIANPAPRTAGVKQSWRMAESIPGITIVPHAKAIADPSLVTPGMVFYIDTGGIHGHAGFVADVIGGTLVTVEETPTKAAPAMASAYSIVPSAKSRTSASGSSRSMSLQTRSDVPRQILPVSAIIQRVPGITHCLAKMLDRIPSLIF